VCVLIWRGLEGWALKTPRGVRDTLWNGRHGFSWCPVFLKLADGSPELKAPLLPQRTRQKWGTRSVLSSQAVFGYRGRFSSKAEEL
jgi:hypothetical protein